MGELQSMKQNEFGSSLLENISLATGLMELKSKTKFITTQLLAGAKIIGEEMRKNEKSQLENNSSKESITEEFKKKIEKIEKEMKTLTQEITATESRKAEIKAEIIEEKNHLKSYKSNKNQLLKQYKGFNESSSLEITQLKREIDEHLKIENVLLKTEKVLESLKNSTSGTNKTENISDTEAEIRDRNYTAEQEAEDENIDNAANEQEIPQNETNTAPQNETNTAETSTKQTSFLQIPNEGFLQIPNEEVVDTDTDVDVNLIEIAMKADQGKLNKLISLLRNYRFDTGLKRAQIGESLREITKNGGTNMKEIKKNVEILKKSIAKAKLHNSDYVKELAVAENSIAEKSLKLKELAKQRTKDVEDNKIYLTGYLSQKKHLDSEYLELSNVRNFYIRQGVDPLKL